MRTPEPRSRGVKRFTSAFFGCLLYIIFLFDDFSKNEVRKLIWQFYSIGSKSRKSKSSDKDGTPDTFFKHQTFIPRCIKSVESVKSSLIRLDIV